jgi:hypothetical protein
MNWNYWMRQIHRWLSVFFTMAVIANGATILKGKYYPWLGYMAGISLFTLLLTGLYLFALPYAPKLRMRRRYAPQS